MSEIAQLPGEIITEIEMSHLYHYWIIFEGDSDERLFLARSFSRQVKSIVAKGRENVCNIIQECESLSGKIVIGLIDRDYRDITNTQPDHKKIVLTDYHDIENILFESSALLKIYTEYGSLQKMPLLEDGRVNFSQIKRDISRSAFLLGKLRAHCFKNGINVCFNRLDHAKFISDRDLSIDFEKLSRHLCGFPENHDISIDLQLTASQKEWIPEEYQSPLLIRHGHDLMAIIAISFRKKWASKGGKFSREDIESFFRISISDQELQSHGFWKNIEQIFDSYPGKKIIA